MVDRSSADPQKLAWFEHYARLGFQDFSSVHVLPYDHSILLENLMDPAHIPISHDRTNLSSKRENAQALAFEVTKCSSRGFVGQWCEASNANFQITLRFEAPCALRNDKEYTDQEWKKQYYINEVLLREKVPTRDLYLSLKSCDTWVTQYRKWLDRVGHGMPYYFGHQTFRLPQTPALLEAAPAGLVVGKAALAPTKGGLGTIHSPDPTNRYFRHVIHCKECIMVLKAGLGVANGGLDAEETQVVFDLLNHDLSALLKMTSIDFWKAVVTDVSLHQILDTYLIMFDKLHSG
ncbi:hypothetical protein KI387_023716 [Taxus chinensis]|uniref:Uncharacterized protein n=1 Tax=Taxus chinensis TaxID=29808 RepID=A0AA38G5C5_TAXCH|nr:hypothetical protein KI387_023716 [Taxus chinensis]